MAGTRDRRLDSWKEIAAHLGVSVRTAQRWEKSEGLPVRRHVHDKLGTAYAFAGEVDAWHETRSLRPPAHVETPSSTTTRQSLAVLPFSALDRDEETQSIADGLTDELITALSQVTTLRVVARASSFHFKGRDLDVLHVGRQLRVDTVLTGRVRRSETALRVSAQLIDTADGCHLWARRFENTTSAHFELEDEITKAVTVALRARLSDHPIAHHRPSDVRAYNMFLRARYSWNQRDREGLEKALVCYREALKLEPTFASAHAGMAECGAFLWAYAGYEWAPTVAAAETAAFEALRIEPRSNDGHRSLGLVRIAQNDLSGACAAFHRALDLNSSDARARHWLAMAGAALGRLDEGLTGIVAALDADPLSTTANQDYGRILYLSRQYEEAIVQLQYTLEIAPHARWARIFLGFAYVQIEAYDDALTVLEFHTPLAAFVRGRAGDVRSVRRLLQGSTSGDLGSTWAGLLHLGLGEIDSAMMRLRDAKRDHELELLELCPKVQPLFAVLRSHPQFEEVLPR